MMTTILFSFRQTSKKQFVCCKLTVASRLLRKQICISAECILLVTFHAFISSLQQTKNLSVLCRKPSKSTEHCTLVSFFLPFILFFKFFLRLLILFLSVSPQRKIWSFWMMLQRQNVQLFFTNTVFNVYDNRNYHSWHFFAHPDYWQSSGSIKLHQSDPKAIPSLASFRFTVQLPPF